MESTELRIGETQTRVAFGQDRLVTLPIGSGLPGTALLRQPPTPLELEEAIAAIEDVVMPVASLIPQSTQLVTSDALAAQLAGLVAPQARESLQLDEVEALFNDMVAVSQGRPSAGSPYLDASICGYLLVLREFMHHVSFDRVQVNPGLTASARHPD